MPKTHWLVYAENGVAPKCRKRIGLYVVKSDKRKTVEATKRIKEWYWTNSAGKIHLSVRYGSKTLELAKGKNAIELNSGDELLATLVTLKDAVIAGELDDAIAQASDKLKAGFTK